MAKISRFDRRLQFSPENTHKIFSLVGKIDEFKGGWKVGQNLSPQTLSRLKKTAIITSTGASTRIEGSLLSDEEVDRLLDGLTIEKLTTREAQEVAGYADLLTNVFDSYKKIKLTTSVIKHFHAELLKYSVKDERHRGEYKFSDNRVEVKEADGRVIGVLFDPTPPHLVSKEMDELICWTREALTQKKIHPLLIIANFIFEFLAIHPFQDGNGRTSRVLTNLLLLQEGYEYVPYVSHEKIIEDNKKQYYKSLHSSQKTWKTEKENVESWVLFFLTVVNSQAQKAMELMNGESMEVLLSERQLSIWNYIVDHANTTTKELHDKLNIPKPTISQALKKLLSMNKIQRLGAGRAVRYKAVK